MYSNRKFIVLKINTSDIIISGLNSVKMISNYQVPDFEFGCWNHL